MRNVNTLCGQTAECFSIQVGGTYNYQPNQSVNKVLPDTNIASTVLILWGGVFLEKVRGGPEIATVMEPEEKPENNSE